MSTAANFSFGAVLEESVEAACGIGLNETGKILEKLLISEELQVGREIEDICRVFRVTTIDSHLFE